MADVHYKVAEKLVRQLIFRNLERLASEEEREKQTVSWPSSDEFTVENGRQCIANEIEVRKLFILL